MSVAPKIASMDAYLRQYGPVLGRKAIGALKPLHVPNDNPANDFQWVTDFNEDRTPFDPQAHVITAAAKMLDEVGNGFINGECGTGKTIMGMLAIHEHAKQHNNQSAKGVAYRAMVLCPDHLIAVWEEEILSTIPGAIIHRFESWKGIIKLFDAGYFHESNSEAEQATTAHEETVSNGFDGEIEHIQSSVSKNSGRLVRTKKRWLKPAGPEWFIIGRNQSKFEPDTLGIGSPHVGFNGEVQANASTTTRIVGFKPLVDDQERPILGTDGKQKQKAIVEKRVICPSCGMIVLGPKGIPASVAMLAEKRMTCKGHYLEAIPKPIEGSDGKFRIPDGKMRIPGQLEHAKKIGKTVKVERHEYKVVECGEKLWNFTRRPYKYPPANVIQRKLKGLLTYLIIDEVHEHKSDESAQSMAAGKIMGAAKHVLALTGTLIGGYAEHLYPLLMRMSPKTIRGENFEWAKTGDWNQTYGKVDRIISSTEPGEVDQSMGQTSMRKARTKPTQRKVVRPGIMPTMYGRHMLHNTIFITLEELSSELPNLHEYVGGPLAPHPGYRSIQPQETEDDYLSFKEDTDNWYKEYKDGYIDVACEMDPELREEYKRIEYDLVEANKELLKRGSMKLLGNYLWTLMDYPDRPYKWRGAHVGRHAVGYYELPRNRTEENYIGVVSPKDLSEDTIRPKEKKLIEICKREKADGKQSWVYVNMTGDKRDIQPRLKKLLTEAGLKVCILKSKDAEPIERKDWIDKNGPKYDVIICNPVLVATGLTLFSRKPGGHNFSTLIFYETGYNLFTLRQASRRAWRIGQPYACRVYYLYYVDTMQHKAMNLMSRKMAAAAALEGEFSAEGLVGLSDEDNAQMALAGALKEAIDDKDMQRAWTKKPSSAKPKPRSAGTLSRGPEPADSNDEASFMADLAIETLKLNTGAMPVEADSVGRIIYTDKAGLEWPGEHRFTIGGLASIRLDIKDRGHGHPLIIAMRVDPSMIRPEDLLYDRSKVAPEPVKIGGLKADLVVMDEAADYHEVVVQEFKSSWAKHDKAKAETKPSAKPAPRKSRLQIVESWEEAVPQPGTIEEIMERFKPAPEPYVSVLPEPKYEDEPFVLPPISREQLISMFANIEANGMTVEEFA